MSTSERAQPFIPLSTAVAGAAARDQLSPGIASAAAPPAPETSGTSEPPTVLRSSAAAVEVEFTPIFVARTGHRKWLVRLASALVVAVCVVYFWALVAVLTDPSGSPLGGPGSGAPAVALDRGTGAAPAVGGTR